MGIRNKHLLLGWTIKNTYILVIIFKSGEHIGYLSEGGSNNQIIIIYSKSFIIRRFFFKTLR